ncbi:MAG: alpha-amylase family glycosyl hydrolase [Armatimonadota bacterium]
MNRPDAWWRTAVVYHCYVRSFQDSDGDGLGDLPGVISRLDYLADLGIDALWLAPFHPSPDADCGYDISDHCAVDPRLGTMADFDRLVAEAHARGIRIVLDAVLNHTSTAHPWFVASRAAPAGPKRDWYLWRDRPNRWMSVFGGSAWTRDPGNGKWYFHSFLPEQADVDWRNPEVRQAQFDVLRFWAGRGVDGFRFDVFNCWFKDAAFRDNPRRVGVRAFDRQRHIRDIDQPEMREALRELRGVFDGYLVGETFLPSPEKSAGYVGGDALDAAFDFSFLDRVWRADRFRVRIDRWRTALGDRWPCWVMGNHDWPRPASRYGSDARCRIATTLLLTLPGTAFLYYGDELGLRDLRLPRRLVRDPLGRRYWPFHRGRDGIRTPMAWDRTAQGGFTRGTPWLPVAPDAGERSVEAQSEQPESLLAWTRSLLALRRAHPAFAGGEFQWADGGVGDVLAFRRGSSSGGAVVALNMSGRGGSWRVPEGRWRVGMSSAGGRGEVPGGEICAIAPLEALVLLPV